MSQERPAPPSLVCREQLEIDPAQKFIYCENTRRNMPRTHLTDKTKPPCPSFFICPFVRVLLCPILEKIRLFWIQCAARWLLCYVSGEGASGDRAALSHQALHRSPATTHRVLPLIPRPAHGQKELGEKSPSGVGRQNKRCGWTLAPGRQSHCTRQDCPHGTRSAYSPARGEFCTRHQIFTGFGEQSVNLPLPMRTHIKVNLHCAALSVRESNRAIQSAFF